MLTQTGLHSIRAVSALAKLRPGQFVGAAALAREIGAPQNYLGKLLQVLAQHGIVVSQRGLGGGFRLKGAPKDVSLYDVVAPVERLGRWSGCILGRPECSETAPCALHHRWKVIRSAYLDLLQSTTVSQIIGNAKSRPRKPV